jgi:hypothetical protein
MINKINKERRRSMNLDCKVSYLEFLKESLKKVLGNSNLTALFLEICSSKTYNVYSL